MINPFNISNNKRYTLDDRTIIIVEVVSSNVTWYYLDELWKYQPKNPNLHNSSKWWLMLHAQKYKFS